jgi:hypothetical protein
MSTAPRVLYRDLLRLHAGLPPLMRELGTTVLKQEWRSFLQAHRNGKATEAHWKEFSAQWLQYKEQLTAGPAATPIDDEAKVVMQLSPEQRLQLEKLREQARALGQAATPPGGLDR